VRKRKDYNDMNIEIRNKKTFKSTFCKKEEESESERTRKRVERQWDKIGDER
jgi:hypothetical protein